MHNVSKFTVIASLTLLSFASFAVENLQTAEHEASKDSDVTLTSQVRDALVDNGIAKPGDIQVDTADGVVQLSGFVDSESTQELALTAAKKVEGVQSVRNDLVVRSSSPSAVARNDDTVIAAKVRKQLQEQTNAQTARDVNVEVSEGVVQLSGFVPSLDAKNRAADVVASVAGVKDVRNDIALDR